MDTNATYPFQIRTVHFRTLCSLVVYADLPHKETR
jgi:hypothetical protein